MNTNEFTMNEVITEIKNEVVTEFNKQENENFFTENQLRLNKAFRIIIMKTIMKILKPLKIRITIFWNEKEIFTYEIPKN